MDRRQGKNSMAEPEQILKIENLHVKYVVDDETTFAVNGIGFTLNKGETLGIVGETGAGKTTTALSILRLLPKDTGIIYKGSIRFKDEDITSATEAQMRAIRGNLVSMIFQDPMTSLNPVLTVEDQIAEVLELHTDLGREQISARVDEILKLVGIEPKRKTNYPHQFSGGMKQRVVIAIALACEPELLIADEPTTALDVTIQAQVLDLIEGLKKKLGTAMILITHDLGIVAETCDKVAIMYAGELIEYGLLEEIFDRNTPHHPYTEGLFGSIPDLKTRSARLNPIDGLMPDPTDLPPGCKFNPRCPKRGDICKSKDIPVYEKEGYKVKCVLFSADAQNGAGGTT